MDHTTILAGGRPILALDMYEHSYHMDYGAKATTYVETFMAAIKWSNVSKLLDLKTKSYWSGRELYVQCRVASLRRQARG